MIHNFRGTLRNSHATLQQLMLSSYGAAPAWVPTDLADLEVWFDFSDPTTMFTDAGSTPVVSDGDLIYQINDKSGNGKNASQSTEANRPAYKTNIQNALSMGLGDGSNDCMDFTDLSLVDFYCLAVIKTPASISYDGWVSKSTISFNYLRSNSSEVSYMSGNSNDLALTLAGVLSTSTVHLVEVRRSSNDMKCWVDGVDQTNGTKTDDGSAWEPGMLFTYGYWPGHIGEFLIYSSAISGDDLAVIRAWANAKWSVY